MPRIVHHALSSCKSGCILRPLGDNPADNLCHNQLGFFVDMGELTVVGPAPLFQDRTCVIGQTCRLDGFIGQGLANFDRMLVLDTCAVPWSPNSEPRTERFLALNSGEVGSRKWTVSESGASLDFGTKPIDTSGGEYRLCWCASGFTCSLQEDFKVDMGRLMLIGPHSLALQARTCVSGQECLLYNITGVELASTRTDGVSWNQASGVTKGGLRSDTLKLGERENFVLLETCGVAGYYEEKSIDARLLPEVRDGTSARIQPNYAMTMAGGQYRLCWCATGFACNVQSDFRVDVGTMQIVGPRPLFQDRTCVAGQTCRVESFLGHGLIDHDHFHVLDTCGVDDLLPKMPYSAMHFDTTGSGAVASWGSIRVSAKGGMYRLCWCATGYPCSQAEHFRVDMGRLTLIGPSPLAQDATCVSGQQCNVKDRFGHLLSQGDRVILLDTCAVTAKKFYLDSTPGEEGRGKPDLQECQGDCDIDADCALGLKCFHRLSIEFVPGCLGTGENGWDYCYRDPAERSHLAGQTAGTLGRWPLEGALVTMQSSGGVLSWGNLVLTSEGGQYRMCWCAAGFQCSVGEDFQVDFGRFLLMGPTPLSQDRTCVIGQTCQFDEITGVFQSEFDRFLVVDTCGLDPQDHGIDVPRFPGFGLYSSFVLSDEHHDVLKPFGWGQKTGVVSWGETPVTAFGGQYRLCWCSGPPALNGPFNQFGESVTDFPCSYAEHFRVDIGRLTLIGPSHEVAPGLSCINGQTCVVDRLWPINVREGDELMLLDTCGVVDGLVPRAPRHSDAGSSFDAPGWFTMQEDGKASFGAEPITAEGGQYRMCWCAADYPCSLADHFRMDIGEMQLIGPRPLFQDRTCVSGQECSMDGLIGHKIMPEDTWLVLDTCGTSTTVPRLTTAGFVGTVNSSGASLYFGDTPITLAGGQYRLCWCSHEHRCSIGTDFRVDVGQFTVVGPAGGDTGHLSGHVQLGGRALDMKQDRTCVSGLTCSFSAPRGHYISVADRYFVLDTCGTPLAGLRHTHTGDDGKRTMIERLPNAGKLTLQSLPGSSTQCIDDCKLSFGSTTVTAPGGQYRLCWCAGSFSCSVEEHFRVDVGEFTLVGPAPLTQHRTCVSGQRCTIDGILGQDLVEMYTDLNLAADLTDHLAILETCGIRDMVQRAPHDLSDSAPARAAGAAYVFRDPITAPGGTYQLCWCPSVGQERANQGQRESKRALWSTRNVGHCKMGEHFAVNLGSLTMIGPYPLSQDRTCVSGQTCEFAGITGHNLQSGDQFMALETCGHPEVGRPIPRFATSGLALGATRDGMWVSWGETPISAHGGIYRLCWCAAASFCDTAQEFNVDMGKLMVIGPIYRPTLAKEYSQVSGSRTLLLEEPVGEPVDQVRECVAGLPCDITGLFGLHISAADSFAILDTCGNDRAAIYRFANTGRPNVQTSDGMTALWDLPQSLQTQKVNTVSLKFTIPVTAQGGQYRICWCSEKFQCATSGEMRTDLGQLIVQGPTLFQKRTCVSAQDCWIEKLVGKSLDIEDKLMILNTCGVVDDDATDLNGTYIQRFANAGLATTRSLQGVLKGHDGVVLDTIMEAINQRFDFSGVRITAGGGEYRMCWCAGGYNCSNSGLFRIDLGTLVLQGPSPLYQDRTCMSGQVCRLRALRGQDLTPDDSIMILDTCGKEPTHDNLVPRFTNDGIATANYNNGASFGWKDARIDLVTVVTAAGGNYRLCWCRPSGAQTGPGGQGFNVQGRYILCAKAEDYGTDLGQLMLLGPAPVEQARTCVSGQTCEVLDITGNYLSAGDTIHILDTCGTAGAEIPRLARDGLSLPGRPAGSMFSWGEDVLTAAGGEFRMCWCARGYSCYLQEHFAVDIGRIEVIGPGPRDQQVYCASGLACWGVIDGQHLTSGDQLQVLEECGLEVERWPSVRGRYPEVPGFPDHGVVSISPYIQTAFTFSWGAANPITAAGGVYKLCWCSPAVAPCEGPEDYRVQAGLMLLTGPSEYIADFFADPLEEGPSPIQSIWRKDMPVPETVVVSDYGNAMSVHCLGVGTGGTSTVLEGTRGAMPIVYVDAPSSGHWEARVRVHLAVHLRDISAGFTVTDKDGDRPDLLFGLDRWTGRNADGAGVLSVDRYSELGRTGPVEFPPGHLFHKPLTDLVGVIGNVTWIDLKLERDGSGRYSMWYSIVDSGQNHDTAATGNYFDGWLAPDDVSDTDHTVRQHTWVKTSGEKRDRLYPETEWRHFGSDVVSHFDGRRVGLYVMAGDEGGTAKFKDFLVRDRYPISTATYRLDDGEVREAIDPYLPAGHVGANVLSAEGRNMDPAGSLLFGDSARRLTSGGADDGDLAFTPADPFGGNPNITIIDFTISVWIKPYSLNAAGIIGRRLEEEVEPRFSPALHLTPDAGLTVSITDEHGAEQSHTFETPSSLPDAPVGSTSARTSLVKVLEPNVWTHIVVAKQGGTLTLYQNNEIWSFSKNVSSRHTNGTQARLLANFLPDADFHGAIDDLRFFDIALTRFAVGHLYGDADVEVPRGKTQRCVAGQSCRLVGMSGLDLVHRDRVAIMRRCGGPAEVAVEGFPGGALSDETTEDGQIMEWGAASGVVSTAAGGVYQLCWCAPTVDPLACTSPEEYRVYIGSLVMIGPHKGQHRTCTTGQIASFDITGMELDADDKVLILDTCGTGSPVTGLPQSSMTTLEPSRCVGHVGVGVADGKHAHGSSLTGKTLTECCALCERSLFGDCVIWVFRPSDLTCFLYREVTRVERRQDRVLGVTKEWQSPEPTILVTTLTSSRMGAGSSSGEFRLFVCRSEIECARDHPVHMSNLYSGFQTFNASASFPPGWSWASVEIQADSEDRWYLHSLVVAAHGLSWNFTYNGWIEQGAVLYLARHQVVQYSFGGTWSGEHVSMTSGGRYRLCWCAEGYHCESPEDYTADAGELSIMGPAPLLQHRTCVSGQSCRLVNLTGNGLDDGDMIMILDTCGQTGFINSGASSSHSDPCLDP